MLHKTSLWNLSKTLGVYLQNFHSNHTFKSWRVLSTRSHLGETHQYPKVRGNILDPKNSNTHTCADDNTPMITDHTESPSKVRVHPTNSLSPTGNTGGARNANTPMHPCDNILRNLTPIYPKPNTAGDDLLPPIDLHC